MNNKRRKTGKSTVQKLENEIKREERKQERNLFRELIDLVNAEQLSIAPHQLQMLSRAIKAKSVNKIDIGYLKTVLFPELYSYDIPQPMSNMSFCKFTDKQDATISTGNDGSNGSGMLIWYPKVNFGPSLFLYQSQSSTQQLDQLPIAFSSGALNTGLWKVGFIQQYDTYFSQTALVAASLQLQYIGQLQTESGYFVGSQLVSAGINAINVDDVENGQFRVFAKPGEGLRLVYMPKDQNDFSYYPTRSGIAHNTGNAGANEDQYTLTGTYNVFGGTGSQTYSTVTTYMNNSPCIAIYWKGLPQSQNYLRIDAVRKFNGIPKQNIRDIVSVERPKRSYDAKKTTDVIQQLSLSVPQLGGHTIKQMDQVSDEIQQFLPNIGHLYQSGQLKESMTLGGLSENLALQQAGLKGPVTNTGRIWDTE